MNLKLIIIGSAICLTTWLNITDVSAQCRVENPCFKSGEQLSYNLYFQYGIILTKAGVSSLNVSTIHQDGEERMKMVMLVKTTGMASSVFDLTDTLTVISDKHFTPFSASKDAHEGGDHTFERLTYSYDSQGTNIKTFYKFNGQVRADTTYKTTGCAHDLLGIMYYARTLNFDTMKPGQKAPITCITGRDKLDMALLYEGREKIKGDDGRKYDCHHLILVVDNSKAFANKNKAMQIYITADANHLPVRIDSKLKVGSTRVILKNYKGLKY